VIVNQTKQQVTINEFETFVLPRLKNLSQLEAAFTQHPTTAIARECEGIEGELDAFMESTHIKFTAETADVLLRIGATLGALRSERAIATHDAHPAAFTKKPSSTHARPRKRLKRLRSSR
jgi:hypothetical protein